MEFCSLQRLHDVNQLYLSKTSQQLLFLGAELFIIQHSGTVQLRQLFNQGDDFAARVTDFYWR